MSSVNYKNKITNSRCITKLLFLHAQTKKREIYDFQTEIAVNHDWLTECWIGPLKPVQDYQMLSAYDKDYKTTLNTYFVAQA